MTQANLDMLSIVPNPEDPDHPAAVQGRVTGQLRSFCHPLSRLRMLRLAQSLITILGDDLHDLQRQARPRPAHPGRSGGGAPSTGGD